MGDGDVCKSVADSAFDRDVAHPTSRKGETAWQRGQTRVYQQQRYRYTTLGVALKAIFNDLQNVDSAAGVLH